MNKKYALDEPSFKPSPKGSAPALGQPARSKQPAASHAGIPVSEIPDDLKEVFKKYPTPAAVIKSGDAETLDRVIKFLKTRPNFGQEELSSFLLSNASTIKPDLAQVLLDNGATLDLQHERLDAVFTALEASNDALVTFFVDTGVVSANHAMENTTTLLMAALRKEAFALADHLFAAGAEVDAVTGLMAGQHTALHYAAAQGSFQSVIWLIEHKANPTLENYSNKWPCELVPKMDSQSQEWDMDCMFESLDAYARCWNNRPEGTDGKALEFEIPLRLREMAYLESTPMSQMESMVKAMTQGDAGAPQEAQGVLPSKGKKMGF